MDVSLVARQDTFLDCLDAEGVRLVIPLKQVEGLWIKQPGNTLILRMVDKALFVFTNGVSNEDLEKIIEFTSKI
jgi:hypothetical protein